MAGISELKHCKTITPDENGDWLDQADRSFDQYALLGDKKDKERQSIFANFSQGVMTSRDAWCFNFSNAALSANMQRTIKFSTKV